MKVIEKPWGKEEILEVNDNYVVKRLTMNAGCKCSLQYHNEKMETIYVLKGPLYVHTNHGSVSINENMIFSGEYITITAGTVHRMEAKETEAVYLECSTPQLDDVVRIEDDYNRI